MDSTKYNWLEFMDNEAAYSRMQTIAIATKELRMLYQKCLITFIISKIIS